jgi:hypothetical protein
MIGFNCDGIDSIYCISNDIYLNNEIDYPKGVKNNSRICYLQQNE